MNIPIIILASERSGSNLLRTLIGKHKDICAPVAPHFMTEFYNIRSYYNDLRNPNNSLKLLEDMMEIVNHPFHDWNMKFDIKKFSVKAKSIIKARDAIYTEMARQQGKIHYCTKGINSFYYIDPFRSELKNVKFIHLVRDPRDHVASWMRRPIHMYTPYDAVIKWKSEQEEMIDAISTRGLECISVKYEELICNPQIVMCDILNYIGVDVDPNCFTTDPENEESHRNIYWKNLSKPIISDNKGKYRNELSDDDILIIESIAKNEMQYFGYKCCTSSDWVPQNDFSEKLERMRAIGKNKGVKNVNNNMGDLSSKWELSKNIRNRRMNEWLANHPKQEKYENFNHIDSSDIQYTGTLRNRVTLMSYGLFGESITRLVVKKIKSLLFL